MFASTVIFSLAYPADNLKSTDDRFDPPFLSETSVDQQEKRTKLYKEEMRKRLREESHEECVDSPMRLAEIFNVSSMPQKTDFNGQDNQKSLEECCVGLTISEPTPAYSVNKRPPPLFEVVLFSQKYS